MPLFIHILPHSQLGKLKEMSFCYKQDVKILLLKPDFASSVVYMHLTDLSLWQNNFVYKVNLEL